MKYITNLKEINILCCEFGSKGFKRLSQNLKYITKVTSLGLSGIYIIILENDIGIDGIKEFSNNLKYITNLIDLHMHRIIINLDINLGDGGIKEMSENINCLINIKKILLNDCNIGLEGIIEFSKSLIYLTSLVELNLSSIIFK